MIVGTAALCLEPAEGDLLSALPVSSLFALGYRLHARDILLLSQFALKRDDMSSGGPGSDSRWC